jgi:hypothetical protein
MKRKVLFGSLAFLMCLAISAVAAQQKPNFTGTWVLDRSRSIGLPPGIEQTMTVVQNGDKIELETKVVSPQGEQVIKDSYMLDGKEGEFTPQGANVPPNTKGKRTSKWFTRGNGTSGVLVSEETTATSDKGTVTNQLMRKWIMSPDGTTITIDMYHDGPRGSFETKRIFVKK